jgi:hypothetical protein
LQAANASGHAEDFVSRLEYRHIRRDSLDHASQIHSENRWKLDPRMRRVSCPDLGVQWVYSTGLDANERLTLCNYGLRSFAQSKWSAMTFEYKGAHGW